MPTEFSLENINDYFKRLNSIAKKISFDIDKTKSDYEHIWCMLNPNEHNEIINETLMKPEISLRYFDNFSIKKSESSLSLSSVVTPSRWEDATSRSLQQLQSQNQLDTRRFYDFDGRNLSTYSKQKVGLKVVQDEAFGIFRDSHSLPFSFKTKSQINLRVFLDDENATDPHNNDAFSKPSKTIQTMKPKISQDDVKIPIDTFQKLRDELASNLTNRNKNESNVNNTTIIQKHLNRFDKVESKYERFYDESVSAAITDAEVGNRGSSTSEFNIKIISKNSKFGNKFHHSKYNYSGDSKSDEDEYERLNLMINCCNSMGNITTSSSSAPSEDDEKTLCGDLKLLLENDGLRKGFDFLNNW